jgi:copper chaperone
MRDMEIEVAVEGMDCQHCERTIRNAILGRDAAAKVEVDLESGRVHAMTRLSEQDVVEAIQAEGYRIRAA